MHIRGPPTDYFENAGNLMQPPSKRRVSVWIGALRMPGGPHAVRALSVDGDVSRCKGLTHPRPQGPKLSRFRGVTRKPGSTSNPWMAQIKPHGEVVQRDDLMRPRACHALVSTWVSVVRALASPKPPSHTRFGCARPL